MNHCKTLQSAAAARDDVCSSGVKLMMSVYGGKASHMFLRNAPLRIQHQKPEVSVQPRELATVTERCCNACSECTLANCGVGKLGFTAFAANWLGLEIGEESSNTNTDRRKYCTRSCNECRQMLMHSKVLIDVLILQKAEREVCVGMQHLSRHRLL